MSGKETFAVRLKEVRLQTGKNQKDFATMVQSTAATISAYENATKNPSLEIVINIAEKCNVSIDWLCGLSEERAIEPKTYKDMALKILKLLQIDTYPYNSYWVKKTINNEILQVITIPKRNELLKFLETYGELNALLNKNAIKQHVIDTWLDGALEELSSLPLNNSDELPFN